MADLYNVQNGNVAMAADVNQYKTALEGGSEQQYALHQKTGADMIIRLPAGRQLSIQDSTGVTVALIDDEGNIAGNQIQAEVYTGPSMRRLYCGAASTDLVKNADTTLENVEQLGINVPAVDLITGTVELIVNTNASAGVKVAITPTESGQVIAGMATFYTSSGVSNVRVTDFTAGVGTTAAVTRVTLNFAFVPAQGTYQIQAAQNASHASDTTIYSLSYMQAMSVATLT